MYFVLMACPSVQTCARAVKIGTIQRNGTHKSRSVNNFGTFQFVSHLAQTCVPSVTVVCVTVVCAMSTAARLTKELDSLIKMLVTRHSISGDVDKTSKVCTSMTQSFCAKLVSAHLELDDIHSLMALVTETQLPAAF